MTVREMDVADCEAVSAVRVRGWRFAYPGLIPQTYLDALDIERDAARRRERFGRGGDGMVDLVAERDGDVVGWGCWGACRDPEAPAGSAEVYALYVRPDRVSTGVGRGLLDEVIRRASATGHRELLLWVLNENERARRFYTRARFAPDGARRSFDVDGVQVDEMRYARSLSASAAADSSPG